MCARAGTNYRKYIKVDFSSKMGKCIGVAFCIKPFFHLKGNVTVNVDVRQYVLAQRKVVKEKNRRRRTAAKLFFTFKFWYNYYVLVRKTH